MANPSPSAAALSAAFDAAPEFTVGIEEELMLLDPATLELAPVALDVLARFDGDGRFKAELPASQVEIITAPHTDVGEAIAELHAGRRDLAAGLEGEVELAAAGVSPLGSGQGELNRLPRYERTRREYGPLAGRQLVCALQIHVAVPGADRALAVYNAARSRLPLLAALAANAAVYEGRDTGLASVRPKLGELLPRQGVPPALRSWEEYAAALRWGVESGAFPDASAWWWELRPHPRYGTLEFRVPDSQATIGDAAAIAAVIQALVVWLAERHDAGEPAAEAPTWRIEENRWSACRRGVEGGMADLQTGAVRSTRDWLEELLETLAPLAKRLGSAAPLGQAAQMVEINGAIRQRQIMHEDGAPAVARWLVEGFLAPWVG
ncbi:MAG: YbdK family carboxylate-amine ligase [Solirubrobacterales bacterium]|nr:YbdK family carboxylate-amine ligase [Solirubrobacterales bacterium]